MADERPWKDDAQKEHDEATRLERRQEVRGHKICIIWWASHPDRRRGLIMAGRVESAPPRKGRQYRADDVRYA